MEYLKIKNWDQFQHYKKRNPPWIKLYHSLLDDFEYSLLKDDSKLLLISFFMLAAKTNNKIPLDIPWIKAKTMINKKIDIQPLVNSGFICVYNDASKMLATDASVRREEKSREEKRKKQFQPPTLEQVKTYFKEKGYRQETAEKAFEYYSTANWKDSQGRQVKSWKQKMLAVWMTDANKEPARAGTIKSQCDKCGEQTSTLIGRLCKDCFDSR